MFIVHFAFVLTALLIVAFFLFFAASRASGATALFGRLLGLWVLVLAAVVAGGIVTAHMNGGKPYGMDMPWGPHHHGWMHRWGPPDAPPPPDEPAPAPEQPAPPAEPAPPAPPAG